MGERLPRRIDADDDAPGVEQRNVRGERREDVLLLQGSQPVLLLLRPLQQDGLRVAGGHAFDLLAQQCLQALIRVTDERH
jgi:hypothetical protein